MPGLSVPWQGQWHLLVPAVVALGTPSWWQCQAPWAAPETLTGPQALVGTLQGMYAFFFFFSFLGPLSAVVVLLLLLMAAFLCQVSSPPVCK